MVQHFKETTVIWDCEMHKLINPSLALVTGLWNFPFRWRDSDDVYSQKGSCENISWETVLRNIIFHRDIASASDRPMELRISQAGFTVFALKSLATFIPIKNIFLVGWGMLLDCFGWAFFGSVLLASLALPAMGRAKRNSGSSAVRAPSSVADTASDAGSATCTSGADSWLRLVSFNNHHWLSGGWGLCYGIWMWWFISTIFFPAIKSQSMANKICFYCHHLGFNPLVTEIPITPHQQQWFVLESPRLTMWTSLMSTRVNAVSSWTCGLMFKMLMLCWFGMVAKRPLLFLKGCQHGFCAINSIIYTKSALCRRPSMLRTSTLRWLLTGWRGKHTNVARIGGVTILYGLHVLGPLSSAILFCWGVHFTNQSINVSCQKSWHPIKCIYFSWIVLAKTPVRATAVDKIMRFHFEKPAPYPLTLKVWVPSLGIILSY